MKRTLYVMRGLPGSGKSTRAEAIAAAHRSHGTVAVLSTDQYWMRAGVYAFDATKLPDAHAWNYRRAVQAMDEKTDVVVIDNTNILRRHFSNYIEAARQRGYAVEEVVIGTFDSEFVRVCYERGVHGVPLATIQWMAYNFEE